MKINRIMIAAPKSGSGKTTITCALLQKMKESTGKVISFKCGPDYIDPMFHERVLGITSRNLDTFFTGEEVTRALFQQNANGYDLAVMEGVMGLYDGLGGIRPEGSSYHLAQVTQTPILLVIDAKGMGRSVIALLKGFLDYDTNHLIRGVLFNRMSKGYYDIIKPLVETELSIAVVGYLPENPLCHVPSRHLGLVMPQEVSDWKEDMRQIAEALSETVSMERILAIAGQAEELPQTASTCPGSACSSPAEADAPVIGVARDEAFCFYYADNIRMLEEAGAKVRYFSPIHDEKLPEDVDGLLLGGGYPELHLPALSHNSQMRESIRQAVQNGMPIVAECGGFMYLHEAIEAKNQESYPMAGVIPGKCFDTGRLVRFGYVELEEPDGWFLPENARIRGHEFHYYDSTCNGADCLAIKPVTGRSYSCILAGDTYWMGFPHLYYPSNPVFVQQFVQKVRKQRTKRG